MKYSIQQTSLESYTALEPRLWSIHEKILWYLENAGESNSRLISLGLRIERDTVSPRLVELEKKGLVEECGVSVCPITNKNTKVWRKI